MKKLQIEVADCFTWQRCLTDKVGLQQRYGVCRLGILCSSSETSMRWISNWENSTEDIVPIMLGWCRWDLRKQQQQIMIINFKIYIYDNLINRAVIRGLWIKYLAPFIGWSYLTPHRSMMICSLIWDSWLLMTVEPMRSQPKRCIMLLPHHHFGPSYGDNLPTSRGGCSVHSYHYHHSHCHIECDSACHLCPMQVFLSCQQALQMHPWLLCLVPNHFHHPLHLHWRLLRKAEKTELLPTSCFFLVWLLQNDLQQKMNLCLHHYHLHPHHPQILEDQ